MRNPLTLEAFADWAGKQPKRRKYDADDIRICAFAQYLKWVGFADPRVGNTVFCDGHGPIHFMPAGIDAAVRATPHTFRSLATRLRA